jgi:drug/metabolite transporter (DMT)-like permease
MSIQEFGLMLLAILSSAFGQLFLKLGALQLGEVNSQNAVSHILSIARTPFLLTGLLAYGMGAIFYILVLTRVNLSVAAPSAALIYVVSILIGYFFFKEVITPVRVVGTGFIAFGVILVASQ